MVPQADERGGAPGLRVLICVLHESGSLLPALAASLGRELEADEWQVVLVDSGSSDGGLAAGAELLPGSCAVALDGNRGFAAGINAGVRQGQERAAASGRPVAGFVVMNPDVTPRTGCLDAMVEALDPSRGVGITAPRLLDERGSLLPSLRPEPTVRGALADALLGGVLAARLRLPTEVLRAPRFYAERHDSAAWATGGLLAFSPETFVQAGPWNEDYFLYEEEVEFCLRARDRGLRLLYLSDVEAVRCIGEAPVTPWAEALMRTNRIRHLHRRSGIALSAAYWAVTLLALTLRSLQGRSNARAARRSVARMHTPREVMLAHAQRAGTGTGSGDVDRRV